MSPRTLWRPPASLSATLVTLKSLRSLDCIRVQHYEVSTLTVLTALRPLTLYLVDDMPFRFDYQSCMATWSEFAKLPHLHTLSVRGCAFLDVKDFQAIAVLSCLTKLHFEGFDSNFRPEVVNKLSALASLQSLYLEFIYRGPCHDAVDELDVHLRTLLNSAKMQHFQVISK